MPLPDKARSHAVLIGTGTYQHLPDLPSITNNLCALRAALTEPVHGSFAPDRCVVVENEADQSLVARRLADVAAAAEDVLLVYYTGHGLIGTRRQELFLGLSATDPARPQYSALPFSWIRDELLDSVAATKVLILDCCFSGLAVEGFLADQDALVQGQVSVRGTYTLAATPANMAALAPPGAEHTAFSGELLTLLRDGVPTGPPELDLRLIYQRLTQRMNEQGWPTPKQYGTDNVLSLALARNPARRQGPRPVPPVPANEHKTHRTLTVIGHTRHGKSMLTTAIANALQREGAPGEIRIGYQTEVHSDLPISLTRVGYESRRCLFEHVDFLDHGDFVKNVLAGVVRPDLALLAVSALDGPLPGTREQLQLTAQAGMPPVVVALTMGDEATDEEFTELVEMEVRDLLSANGYPEVPIVRVSARGALDGDPRWVQSVRDLVTALEQQQPVDASELPFLLAVEEVVSITGRGVMVFGHVERGRVTRGAEAELVGFGAPVRTVVDGVERFRKTLDVATPGDNVGLLLRHVRREDVVRGHVLVPPGTATARTAFDARVTFLPDHRPTRADFYFRTTDVPGAVRYLPNPGVKHASRIGVRLAKPVAMAVGDRFTVRRDGRSIGFGLVTEVSPGDR